MPEITLNEAQYERLQNIRNELQEAFVGAYGTICTEDAIEYLLDIYTPPGEREQSEAYKRLAEADYPELQDVASNLSSVPGSGIDADEMRGRLVTELQPEELVAQLDAAQEGSPNKKDGDEIAAVGSIEGGDEDQGETDSEGSLDVEPVESGENPGPTLGTAVNRLLEEHDDKWRENDGDAPYEVDLPDGTTETARTKDDVRQLLFQNY